MDIAVPFSVMEAYRLTKHRYLPTRQQTAITFLPYKSKQYVWETMHPCTDGVKTQNTAIVMHVITSRCDLKATRKLEGNRPLRRCRHRKGNIEIGFEELGWHGVD
jgi:hypothetical protein